MAARNTPVTLNLTKNFPKYANFVSYYDKWARAGPDHGKLVTNPC